MKSHLFFLLIGVAIAADQEHEVNEEFLNGYNKFTGDIYSQLKNTKKENFLVSPLSVDILLALAEYGSAGETSKQLVKGLSLPENKEKLREAILSLTPKLNINSTYTLLSANKIYVLKGIKLLESFRKFAEDVYHAEIENIDFKQKKAAAQEMNKWIQEKTLNKILDLVKAESLNDDTRAVLINALYFHGNWVYKFNRSDTKKQAFYLDKSGKAEVELMEIKQNYKYYENNDLKAKFLELPYSGEDVTMTIVLPNDNDGLAALEDNISKVLADPRYKEEQVHVKIPKFKIETLVDFKSALKNLGIVNAFEDDAEFPKITGESLKISEVVQKAIIEVEEEGTTAAASTVVYVQLTRSGHFAREIKEFIADHPFIFFLKYRSIVLFIGHYTGQSSV